MELKSINFGPAAQGKRIQVDDWTDATGNPVKVLVRPISLAAQVEMETKYTNPAEAIFEIASRCFLDPDTEQPMGDADEWRQIPMTPGFRKLLSEVAQPAKLEDARKNSNGARRSRSRSKSGS